MIPEGTWTTVAESPAPGQWHFQGFDRRTLMDEVERGNLILMHRRTGEAEFELVARPVCPAWRKIRRWLAHNPLPPRPAGRMW